MVKPQTAWTISVLGRNILRSRADEFPAEFSGYHIDRDAALELGAPYHPVPSLTVAAKGSTRRMGAAGVEWSIGRSLDLCGGVYMNEEATQFLYALGTGLGWTYEFIDVDRSYLHFFDSEPHTGEPFRQTHKSPSVGTGNGEEHHFSRNAAGGRQAA